MTKSLLDYAYEVVSKSKEPISFVDIWAYVTKESNLSDEEANAKVSRFYTNLLLDGRFVTLGDNLWDLRSRHTFDKVHIDMQDVYSDVETMDCDSEEEAEEEIGYEEEVKEESEDNEEESETTEREKL